MLNWTGKARQAAWLGPWMATVSLYSAACASSGATPKPFPVPGTPPAARHAPAPDAGPDPGAPAAPEPVPVPRAAPDPGRPSASARRSAFDGYALAGTALALRGVPYRNGGNDPAGFDCSGFTQYVFAQYGVTLPREVRDQFRIGASVQPDDLVAGDMIFFTTTSPGPSHVGIAIGGDEFVHAPSSTGVVRVEHLSSSYWSPRFLGARRVN